MGAPECIEQPSYHAKQAANFLAPKELGNRNGFTYQAVDPIKECSPCGLKCEAEYPVGNSTPVTDLPQAESHQSSYFSGTTRPAESQEASVAAAQLAGPQLAGPQLSSPQLSSPQLSSPYASPCIAPAETRQSRDGTLVAEALERLRHDPSVSRGALAEGLGVSPSKLGKAFRAQMGVAFVDYRNQLRLERFLGLVYPGGGNVSAAASSAGFGSYAQFHRVFRALIGKSPKEYLRQQAAHS